MGGTKVERERRTAGLSQEKLAERSGVSVSTIRAIERGSSNPRVSTMGALAKALNIPTTSLLPSDTSLPGPAANRSPGRERHLSTYRDLLLRPDWFPVEREDSQNLKALAKKAFTSYRMHDSKGLDTLGPEVLKTSITTEVTESTYLDHILSFYVVGTHLCQGGANDLALVCFSRGLELAKKYSEIEQIAYGRASILWVMLRQCDFEKAETAAIRFADEAEPKKSLAARPEEYLNWGLMLRWATAAAARNNNFRNAQDYCQVLHMAATGYGQETSGVMCFGPSEALQLEMELKLLAGEPDETIRLAAEVEPLRSLPERRRSQFDLIMAYVRTGETTEASNLLSQLYEAQPHWCAQQPAAAYAINEILRNRVHALPQPLVKLSSALREVAERA